MVKNWFQNKKGDAHVIKKAGKQTRGVCDMYVSEMTNHFTLVV